MDDTTFTETVPRNIPSKIPGAMNHLELWLDENEMVVPIRKQRTPLDVPELVIFDQPIETVTSSQLLGESNANNLTGANMLTVFSRKQMVEYVTLS